MGIKAGIDAVHLVGIGGSGMSGLARMLHEIGVRVSGSDQRENPRILELRALGIDICIGECRLPDLQAGGLIRSAAVPDHDPEVVEARKREYTCLLYSEAVGRLSQGLRTLAIAGTHGKTSTTAMTISALRSSGLDPSYLVGGQVAGLDGNGHGGQSDLFVVEACEFNRSFHDIRPTLAAILNLEPDHFDCYPSREDLEESFALYARNIRPGGSLLLHEDVGSRVLRLLPANIAVLTIGKGLYSDLRAIDMVESRGRYSFHPCWDGESLPRVNLTLPGQFQMDNALFALGLAILAGADPEAAALGLSEFEGVDRRFSVRTGPQGRELVDDYAHHPGEIRAVLSTVRQRYPDRKILVAFQPHQYSRTRHLLTDFGKALALADRCLVADIYAAREDPKADHGVCSLDLADEVCRSGGHAVAAGPLENLGSRILAELGPGYIPVVLGAGELNGVVEEVVRGL